MQAGELIQQSDPIPRLTHNSPSIIYQDWRFPLMGAPSSWTGTPRHFLQHAAGPGVGDKCLSVD